MQRTAKLEIGAGIFLLVVIGILCLLIILLAERPDLLKSTYTVTVQFPDASGLLKGADVDLSGALIGKVASNPRFIPASDKVGVQIKINQEVKIRDDDACIIRDSGFLGDKFVEVRPRTYPPGVEKATYVRNGGVIEGTMSPSLNSLLRSSVPLIKRATHMATQLDDIVTRLNTGVLTDASVDDLGQTVVGYRHLTSDGDNLVANAKHILAQVKAGHGALGRLLYDKRVGDNLVAFMANLKAHGSVFYRDDATPKGPADHGPENETLREKYE